MTPSVEVHVAQRRGKIAARDPPRPLAGWASGCPYARHGIRWVYRTQTAGQKSPTHQRVWRAGRETWRMAQTMASPSQEYSSMSGRYSLWIVGWVSLTSMRQPSALATDSSVAMVALPLPCSSRLRLDWWIPQIFATSPCVRLASARASAKVRPTLYKSPAGTDLPGLALLFDCSGMNRLGATLPAVPE